MYCNCGSFSRSVLLLHLSLHSRDILIELFACSRLHEASCRNKLGVYLHTLTGIIHLFIRFRDVLWILRLDRHLAVPAKHAVQLGYGASISCVTLFIAIESLLVAFWCGNLTVTHLTLNCYSFFLAVTLLL